MALCVCKCLNVTLESEKFEDNAVVEKLDLTPIEQRDIFFSEKLLVCPNGALKSQVAQQALVRTRTVGRWTLHSCLACGQTTHATLQDRNRPCTLICKSTLTTTDRVAYLKKSSNFSPAFNLLVPEVTNDIEMKENMDTNNFIYSNKRWQPTQQVIGTLSKQLNQTLESQLDAVEETVRQFKEQKYAEFEAYREKAQRDHKILASIISRAQSTVDSDWRVDTSLDNGPPSPHLPPLQRRRLSSLKDAKKAHNIIKSDRSLPPEEDSLDAEDLFDLEGMDSRHNMVSDLDDYDSDQGSNDEGVHVARPRPGAGAGPGPDIARSLPMNMPNFPAERLSCRELDDDEEPQDIAASIKALARSVHGDVFDLPRPRFSTQI